MQTIQQIAAEAFANQPSVYLKSETEAADFVKSLNDDADEGEEYVFHAYQGGRFVVALTYEGKVELYL
jgi:hypothetical protein